MKRGKHQNLMDPSLFIGLSKAHNNMLSWIAYYNEGEKSGPGDSSVRASIENHNNYPAVIPLRAKRKFDDEKNIFNGRALKLTKVGSGLLKGVVSAQSAPPTNYKRNLKRRRRMDKKKRLKELARKQSVFASNSPLQELPYIESVSLNINEFLASKMAEEAGQHIPPTQP